MPRKPEQHIPVTQDTEQEFMVTCASFGEMGHADHKWVKVRPSLVNRFRDKMTIDMSGKKAAAIELPYRTMTRNVSPWEDYEYPGDVE